MPSSVEPGSARRLCPHCGAADPIGAGEAVWPVGWVCPACGFIVPDSDGVPTYAPALADLDSGYDTSLFDQLSTLEAGHYWFEPRNRLLTALAQRYFPSAQRFLEVGCGTGFVLNALERERRWKSVTGSELQPKGLRHARRRLENRATFVQMDARHIPARDVFDLVGAFDVLEHIEEDEAVMAGIRDALAPGGGFIMSVPQHPWLWSAADEIGHHVRRYRRGEAESKLKRMGFKVLFSTSFTVLLLPLMALSRRKRATGDMAEHLRREFKLASPLNFLLRAALNAEASASAAGVSWPVGGSRVVVARKL